ncbi:MAG: hypothetical protein J6Y82_08305 [Bacteroidales bacterium]|nr:hypothetical protein [Bacteroidales bacterium]
MKKQRTNKAKHILRTTLRVLCGLIMLLYFPMLMSFVNADKAQTECLRIDAHVANDSPNILITDDGLNSMVMHNFPDIEGTKLCEMHLDEMERIIEQSAVVKKCDMYTTPGGVLHVRITQREPIMHVFTSSSSYYMDAEAFRIVAKSDMRSNVVVVNGNVGTLLEAEDLIALCKYINASAFWRAQIEQIYITQKNEFILVPRVGNHIIEFGTAENMENKFERLHALYTKGWQPREWNKYKKVNLKFNGQIVCTKR